MNNQKINEADFKQKITKEIFKELSRKFHDIKLETKTEGSKSYFYLESHPNELGNGIIEIDFNEADTLLVDVSSENIEKCAEFVKELNDYFGEPIYKSFKTPEQLEEIKNKKPKSLDA